MSVKVYVRATAIPWPQAHWPRLSPDPAAWIDLIRLSLDLLRPLALFAFVLAIWRIGSDLGWMGDFVFHSGLASHWQVWAAVGFAMLGSRQYLSRRV